MPLTDLIRYFNAADSAGESTLYPIHERAVAWHRGLQLRSLFQAIVDLGQEKIVGHQAILDIRQADDSPISPDAAYALCETAESLVHFDRLCRTLHALNFLAQRRHAGGYLQVSIAPRHLLAVPSRHGLVYEAILKRCGLGPADIVLDLALQQGTPDRHLRAALDNYRQRGYRLALSNVRPPSDLALLLELKPDILRLDAAPQGAWIQTAHTAGIAVEQNGIASGQQLLKAKRATVDFGQGSLFGNAEPTCRATHNGRRVTYNSPSIIGALHENRQ